MFADYAKYYDLFNQDKPYDKEINFVYEWAEKPKNILDIGCGTASYWKYYPEETSILGLEKSKEMALSAHPKRGQIYCNFDIQDSDFSNWPKLFKDFRKFDCVTALFDVINYIPNQDWWKDFPLKSCGYFVFDVWDKDKVMRDGFSHRQKMVGRATRYIGPLHVTDNEVDLRIVAFDEGKHIFTEDHTMYLYSHKDIEKFCGKEFEIVETKETESWQKWYKLKRK